MTATAPDNPALRAVARISGVLAAGSALMAIAHAGVQVPIVSAFGPGGSRVILPAAIAFSVAAVLHAAVAYGVARRRGWSWPLGVLVAGATLLAAAVPFRGAGSILGIVLAGAQVVLLLSGTVRAELLPDGPGSSRATS